MVWVDHSFIIVMVEKGFANQLPNTTLSAVLIVSAAKYTNPAIPTAIQQVNRKFGYKPWKHEVTTELPERFFLRRLRRASSLRRARSSSGMGTGALVSAPTVAARSSSLSRSLPDWLLQRPTPEGKRRQGLELLHWLTGSGFSNGEGISVHPGILGRCIGGRTYTHWETR